MYLKVVLLVEHTHVFTYNKRIYDLIPKTEIHFVAIECIETRFILITASDMSSVNEMRIQSYLFTGISFVSTLYVILTTISFCAGFTLKISIHSHCDDWILFANVSGRKCLN